MNWFEPYLIFLTIMNFLIVFLAIVLLQKRGNFGRSLVALSLICASLFIFLSVLELYFSDFDTMLSIRNIQQVPLYLCPVFLYGFVKELIEPNKQKNRMYMAIVSIPSLVAILLIFTDPLHHWMRISVSTRAIWGYTEITSTPTILNMILVTYQLFLVILPAFMLLRNMYDLPRHLRISHVKTSITICLPVLSAFILPMFSIQMPAMIAFSYSLLSIMLILTYRRYDFNYIWPVPRNQILEALSEGVLLFDRQYRLIEINRVGIEIVSKWNDREHNESLVGQKAKELFDHQPIIDAINKEQSTMLKWKKEMNDHAYYYHIDILSIDNYGAKQMIVVITDITAQKEIENRLFRLAHIDTLTNICNRHSFIEKFNLMINKNNRTLSLFILDIDYFKEVNDNYGHIVGDQVLKKFAKALSAFFYQVDKDIIVGRIGGEEFGVVGFMSGEEARAKATEFQVYLNSYKIPINKSLNANITVSIGISSTNDVTSFEKMYKHADERLYVAKENGRNRVEIVREEGILNV